MKILLCEPGRLAQSTNISHDLKAMQAIVGGTVAVTYPWEDPVAVVWARKTYRICPRS